MKLDALFQQTQSLPTIPKVVQELIDTFNNEDVSIEEITRKLTADQVLSAKLLRLANSAYYHVSRTVGTVDDAVTMLGFVTVRTLVISTGLAGGFKGMPGVDLKQFWRHSLHTACAARFLAKAAGQNTELAFTAGLMHAIGELVMHAVMPEQMLAIDKGAGLLDARRADIEHQTFGYCYAEVGAELARRWKFPPDFAAALSAVHSPLEVQPFNPMSGVIHVASWRSRAEENKLTAEELDATWPGEVAAKAGLDRGSVLQQMPSLAELSAGLEDLVS